MTMPPTKKILIIEDEPTLVKALRVVFRNANFEMETSSDGVEALEKITKFTPDLILLDILMPRMNGFEFLEKLNQREEFKHIPVLIYSNYVTEEYKKRGLYLGALEYIGKTDITLSELIAIIKKYINR